MTAPDTARWMRPEVRFDRIVRTIRSGHAGLHRAFTAEACGAAWAGYLLHDCRAWVAVRGAASPGEHLQDDAISVALERPIGDHGVTIACGDLARSLPTELTTVRLSGVVVAVRYLRDLLGIARTAEVLTISSINDRLVIRGEGDTWRAQLSSYPARAGAPMLDVGTEARP